MGKIYRETYQIPFYVVDAKRQVKLSHLVSHALVVSGKQAAQLGAGDKQLFEEQGLIWVVSDYDLHINRLPEFLETITIETEAVGYNKLFCYRDFRIMDEADQLLLTIHSTFVLIDFATRKVRQVPEDLLQPFEAEQVKLKRRAKYQPLDQPVLQERQVAYVDLDMNGHVNNGNYFDWLLDGLPLDFLQGHAPKQVTITYAKEVHYGTTVTTAVTLDGLVSRHEIRTAEGLHTQALIAWRALDDC